LAVIKSTTEAEVNLSKLYSVIPDQLNYLKKKIVVSAELS